LITAHNKTYAMGPTQAMGIEYYFYPTGSLSTNPNTESEKFFYFYIDILYVPPRVTHSVTNYQRTVTLNLCMLLLNLAKTYLESEIKV